MRQAIEQLDVVVCIDVFMTETARLADYVLPALTQFEKHEATFFNFEFPRNVFHLRRPVVAAPEGPLPEPEIHARLVEAAGLLDRGRHRPAAGGRRARPGRVRAPPSPPRPAPTPASVRSGRCCCTARSGRRSPTGPRAPLRCGRWPSAAR